MNNSTNFNQNKPFQAPLIAEPFLLQEADDDISIPSEIDGSLEVQWAYSIIGMCDVFTLVKIIHSFIIHCPNLEINFKMALGAY